MCVQGWSDRTVQQTVKLIVLSVRLSTPVYVLLQVAGIVYYQCSGEKVPSGQIIVDVNETIYISAVRQCTKTQKKKRKQTEKKRFNCDRKVSAYC